MILHKYGDRLYHGLKDVMHSRLKELSQKVIDSNDEKFLEVLNDVWNDHKVSTLMIRDILMYMVTIVNL
jgi:cullin 3